MDDNKEIEILFNIYKKQKIEDLPNYLKTNENYMLIALTHVDNITNYYFLKSDNPLNKNLNFLIKLAQKNMNMIDNKGYFAHNMFKYYEIIKQIAKMIEYDVEILKNIAINDIILKLPNFFIFANYEFDLYILKSCIKNIKYIDYFIQYFQRTKWVKFFDFGNDLTFDLIKYKNRIINLSLFDYHDKILLNLYSKKNRINFFPKDQISNSILLQALHYDKNNFKLINFEKLLNNNKLISYLTYRYSFVNISKIINKNFNFIERIKILKYCDSNLVLEYKKINYHIKTNISDVETLLVLLKNINIIHEKMLIYYINNFIKDPTIYKIIFNFPQFEYLKYRLKYLKNINLVAGERKMPINLFFKFFRQKGGDKISPFHSYCKNFDRVNYYMKIIEKILYYLPESSKYYNFNKHTLIHKSKYIDYNNIYFEHLLNVPFDPDFLKKIINKKNKRSFGDYLNKKKKKTILKICSQLNLSLLEYMPYYNNDYDIVSLSVLNDIKSIKYANINYINEYVKCNFDIHKTLENMKNTYN